MRSPILDPSFGRSSNIKRVSENACFLACAVGQFRKSIINISPFSVVTVKTKKKNAETAANTARLFVKCTCAPVEQLADKGKKHKNYTNHSPNWAKVKLEKHSSSNK